MTREEALDRIKYVERQPIDHMPTTVHEFYGEDDPRTGFHKRVLPVYPPPGPDARRIREQRSSQGLTLGEAARATGIDVVNLSRLERGRAICDVQALLATWIGLVGSLGSPDGKGQRQPDGG